MTRVVEDTQQTCQSKYPDPLTQLLCHGSYAEAKTTVALSSQKHTKHNKRVSEATVTEELHKYRNQKMQIIFF